MRVAQGLKSFRSTRKEYKKPADTSRSENRMRICRFLGSDSDGLPGLEDTDESNQWLCKQCKTFSTVNEAITFLEQLHR